MENITTIKVKVTKEILKKSMMCGTDIFKGKISQNCAIALAVREIFSEAIVNQTHIFPFFMSGIFLNHNADSFITDFDNLSHIPEKRLELPETEVKLYLTDEVIDELNKRENFNWKEIVNNSEILELV